MDPLFFLCIIFSCNVHFEAFYATEARMVLRYYYILELTTIFAVDIDIQENSSPVFIGYYQVEESGRTLMITFYSFSNCMIKSTIW